MTDIHIHYLSGRDVDALKMTDDEIIAAVEGALVAQARGQAIIEPRMHLVPEKGSTRGHFNVLRGVVHPLRLAGVKIVGDFFDNYQHELPSEMAMLYLADPATGRPIAMIDATAITTMRTGAVTAIGAKYLAPRNAKVLGHVGARGTAFWNVKLMDRLYDFDEIRVHSRRRESRDAFAARIGAALGKKVIATDDWQSCVEGADIVVEASRLEAPAPMLKNAWIKKGALVMPYGTMSAVEETLPDIIDKWVMDDFGQAHSGPFGALRKQIDFRPLEQGQPARRDRPDRSGHQAGTRARRRDDPVLAPGPVAVRHRARRRHARQGEAAGVGPRAVLCPLRARR